MPSPGRQVSGIAEPGTVGGGWARERCGIPSTSQRATTRRPGRRAAQCRPAVTSRAAPGAPRGRAEPGRGDATRVPAVVEIEVARRHQKGTNRRTTRRHRTTRTGSTTSRNGRPQHGPTPCTRVRDEECPCGGGQVSPVVPPHFAVGLSLGLNSAPFKLPPLFPLPSRELHPANVCTPPYPANGNWKSCWVFQPSRVSNPASSATLTSSNASYTRSQ